MANFFDYQDRARRATQTLIPLIMLSLVPIFLASYVPAWLLYLFTAIIFDSQTMGNRMALWMPEVFMMSTAATLAMLVVAGLYKTHQLSAGGRAVAEAMKARPIRHHRASPQERQLLNVVAEMAIAAGIPTPRVYVLEDEPGINAFAAGYTTRDAVIAVSRGCLDELDRDELQAVIAHEVSHIFNGDTRLNMRLMAIVHGLVVYHVLGKVVLEISYEEERGFNPYILPLGLFLTWAGALGSWMGQAIKGSINRQREFLADASAIQFTRNGDAVLRVFKKIGGHPSQSRIKSARAEEISHLFFSNSGFLSTQSRRRLLNSHPPLAERVRRFEPGFSGRFEAYVPRKERLRCDLRDETDSEAPDKTGSSPSKAFHISPEQMLNWVDAPGSEHLATVRQMLRQIPPSLHAAAVEANPLPLICVLFLDPDPSNRRRQVEVLRHHLPGDIADETLRLAVDIDGLPVTLRLPLFDLSVPGLRQASPDQVRVLLACLDAMIEVDEKVTLLEIILRHLVAFFGGLDDPGARQKVVQFHALRPIWRHCRVVLSALSHLGHDDEAGSLQAFEAGRAQIDGAPEQPLLPADQCDLSKVSEAMEVLGQLTPKAQKAFFIACVHCVASDELVTVREAELLRGLGHVLDCPLPPMPAPP